MPGRRSPEVLESWLKVVQQGIDQRAAIACVFCRAGARVHHHPCRLVDHGEVVVFVNDVQGNIFGDRVQRLRAGCSEDRDVLRPAQLQRRLGGLAIHLHAALLEHHLHARPAHPVQLRDQVLVQPLPLGFPRNVNLLLRFFVVLFRHGMG